MAAQLPPLIRLALLLASPAYLAFAREPVLGGPCDGCEIVFVGLPAQPPTEAQIAPPGEPGAPMLISGRVTTPDGRAAAGIIIYAYQTDRAGIYPRSDDLPREARRHGRLRAWAISDAAGQYRFRTIRPGSYPNLRIAAHVHLHVIEPGKGTYYIDDLHFADDPLLTPADRQRLPNRGGSGVALPEQDPQGAWHARRDIVLGLNIPDYPNP